MLDNFKYFKDVVIDPGEFLYIEIIQRWKDVGGNKNILVAQYTINKIQQLYELEDIIKGICDSTKSRAYIHLNPKRYKQVSKALIDNTQNWLVNNRLDYRFECYVQCVCEVNSIPSKQYLLLDIDTKDEEYISRLDKYIKDNNIYVYKIIPTLHGYHYITRGININDFNTNFSDSKVNEYNYNRSTILYMG